MGDELSRQAKVVQQALLERGLKVNVLELPGSTRTAEEAAASIGCALGQIVKSLIFQGKRSLEPYLVLVSGSNRADEQRLSQYSGEKFRRADADFVYAMSGFAIGGVPPLGHSHPMVTFMDEDLLQYEEIWAAAGTAHAVFPIAPSALRQVTGARVVALKLLNQEFNR